MGDYGSGMMRGNPDGGGMQSRTKGQRVNVQQLKLFVSQFAEPGDPEYAPPVPMCETKAEKKDRIRKSKLDQGAAKVAEELQKYDPQSDPNATGDPYKTLFVARLNYETSEHRVKREFEAYGPIKRVRLVTDKETNKPRGYAFIEYMHTRDMKNAYKQADGRKVDNRRVLVDVERGRTVPNWRPRRLGGGLGSSRIGGENAEQKLSTRDQQHAGRPRSEEPRRDERRADRDREKSRERPRERDRDERTRERSHDRTRERDSKEDRHHHRDRDRTRDRERGRDRERDHGRDRDRDRERDRRDRDRDRDRGRDYERDRDRGHDRHRERGRDRERDYERASHERDRGHVHERDAEYANGEPKHDRNLAGYDQEYGYNYEQHKSHDAYETERSKRHEHEYYQMQPNNTEPEGPEEGEAYDEGDYQYHQAADEHNN
uniref:RRM domain-containing protein n=1 Tax=Oryza barthii TaxID=65489 RepID=A0A0D3HAK9_9ORYZ